jgi:CheY-like chemotaxis protein
MAERVLTRAGYTVIVAEDGAEAVQKFTENADSVQLLVLDAVMPELGGLEACEKIRVIKPDIPTLFCSGYSEDFATGGAGLPKNSVLLQKPYSLDELLASIRQILDQ